MAAKTYAQQVQDLKTENQVLLDRIEVLNAQVNSLEELPTEIESLKQQLAVSEQAKGQGNVGAQAKLVDANQRADSEAALSRRLKGEVEQLTRTIEVQADHLRRYEQTQEFLQQKDEQIRRLSAQLILAQQQGQSKAQYYKDEVVRIESEAAAQSRELQQLRMGKRTMENAVEQMKEASTAIQKQAEERIDFYARLASQQSEQLAVANAAIERYRAVVNSLPDTKSELQAILGQADNAESPIA